MWESRRDFQRVWEGWKAGFMAFHAFHTLSFPWPAFRGRAGRTGDAVTGAMCRTRQRCSVDSSAIPVNWLVGISCIHSALISDF